MANAAVIVLLVIVVVALAALGIASAIASADSQNQHDPKTGDPNYSGMKKCHDYTMWIAIGTWLSAVFVAVALIVYGVSQHSGVQAYVKQIPGRVYNYAGTYFNADGSPAASPMYGPPIRSPPPPPGL